MDSSFSKVSGHKSTFYAIYFNIFPCRAGCSGAERGEARVGNCRLSGISAHPPPPPTTTAAAGPPGRAATGLIGPRAAAAAPGSPGRANAAAATRRGTAGDRCYGGGCRSGRAGSPGGGSRAGGGSRGSVRGVRILRAVWVLRGCCCRGPVCSALRRGLWGPLRPVYGLQRSGGRLRSVRRRRCQCRAVGGLLRPGKAPLIPPEFYFSSGSSNKQRSPGCK